MNAPRDPHDVAFSEAISTLRPSRVAAAGSFHATVRAARAREHRRASRRRRGLAVALAAALPATAALALHLRDRGREHEALRLAEEASVITGWRSPTAALLASPYEDLWREIPALHESLLDTEPQPEAGGMR